MTSFIKKLSLAVAAISVGSLFFVGAASLHPRIASAGDQDGDSAEIPAFDLLLGGRPTRPDFSQPAHAPAKPAPPDPAATPAAQAPGTPPPAEPSQVEDKLEATTPAETPTPPELPQAKGSETAIESEEAAASSEKEGAQQLLKQAVTLAEKEKYSSALGKCALAIKKATDSGDKKTLASALHGAADMAHRLGKDAEALEYINRAIAVNQALKNARARSLDLILAGRILMAQSEYERAVQTFDEGLKLLPVSEESQRPAVLEEKANGLLRLYKLVDALKALGRAAALYEKEGKEEDAARVSVAVGDLHVSRSDYRAARTEFQKAEKIFRTLKRQKDLGEILFRQAYLHQMHGDQKAAHAAMDEGSCLVGDQDAGAQALPLFVRGLKAYHEGKVAQAFKYLTGALNLYEKTGDRIMAVRVRVALGTLQLNRSQLKSALELGGTALAEFRSLSDLGGEAGALLLIAEVYFRQGFVQKAEEYGQEALKLATRIGDRDQMAQARILRAEIAAGHGDGEAVSTILKEALEDAKVGVGRRTKGRLRLAVARYRLSRETLDKAMENAVAARQEFQEISDRQGMADTDHLFGLVHELQGEPKKALTYLQQALTAHQAIWDQFGEGKDLTALGVHYKNLGNHDKALELFGKAVDLRKRIDDRRGYAASVANMGNLLRHRNQIPEAVKNLEQALQAYKELGDRKGEADILTNLGHVDAAKGAQSVALDKFTRALKLHKEISDFRGTATDLASMGRIYLAKGDLEQTATHLEEARSYNARVRNPAGEVAILADLAMLKRAKGDSATALSLLNKALELARQINDVRAVSSLQLKMATILEESGDYDKALKLLRTTLEEMRKQGDRTGELWALGGIGIVQAKTENYEDALANLQEAMKLRDELGLTPSQSRDLDFSLAEIYEGFRDYEKALDHYLKALSLYQTPGNDAVLGRISYRLGTIYYLMEEYKKAQEFFEEALRVHTETRSLDMQKGELMRLGDIAGKLGDSESALRYQQKALALARETKDRQTEAWTLTRIGTLHQTLGKRKVALEDYREAKQIRTELGDKRGVSENLLQIALVSSALGEYDTAVADLKKAFEIAQCSEDRSMLWKAYFIMGRTLERSKKTGEALESYRRALTVLEAMEAQAVEDPDDDDFIFGGRTALYETTLRVLMGLARKDPKGAYDDQALRIVEKLKASSFETIVSRANVESFSDLPQDLLIREKSLKLALRKLNARLAEERSMINPNQERIKKLLEERRAKEKGFNQLKDRFTKEYPSYAELRYPKPISVPHFQKEVLDRDEAVIEFMVTRGRTYLFALDKQRFHTFSIEYSAEELKRDVETLVGPLHRADTQASWDPSVAYRLYLKLIKPVEYFLIGKKAVVVVPHGPLAALPFEILIDSKAHAGTKFWSASDRPSYLLEKYAFCYAPSLAILTDVRTRKRDKKPGWNLVAFGDAVYSDSDKSKERNAGAEKLLKSITATSEGAKPTPLRPLPGARKEILEITKVLGGPTQRYLGAEVTETLFKKADLTRYAYIHLATHGVLLSGSGRLQAEPAILFSLYGDSENDGFLELGEVFGLKLNADMVVVSSSLTPAKTGASETGGLMGLSRAFLFAGSDSVILSNWQTTDESAAKIFIETYRHLNSESKAEALRLAKLELLKNSGTSHPYYWGPFVLTGNWQVRVPPIVNKESPENIQFKGLSAWRKILSM